MKDEAELQLSIRLRETGQAVREMGQALSFVVKSACISVENLRRALQLSVQSLVQVENQHARRVANRHLLSIRRKGKRRKRRRYGEL